MKVLYNDYDEYISDKTKVKNLLTKLSKRIPKVKYNDVLKISTSKIYNRILDKIENFVHELKSNLSFINKIKIITHFITRKK